MILLDTKRKNTALTVKQKIHTLDPSWTKVGYNASLSAEVTKIETNSISTLKSYYDTRDANGNTGNGRNVDDYTTAVVYKDIDVVNVDIKSGEIVGKLSDINYPFEWYGGDVTLPSGTTLASGRVLTTSETFTVDCYTYYPTMYIRRWMVNDEQYITISDEKFPGSTKIDSYYTGTFQSTIFNPDKSVAVNGLGIIPRSYSYWWIPLSWGSVNFLQTYYNFATYNNSTVYPTQMQFLDWANNLTNAWSTYATSHPSISNYITANAKGVQGENWRVWVQNLLYTVKYANNNSQAIVGYGNTYTNALYAASGVTVTTPSGVISGATVGNVDHFSQWVSSLGSVIGLKGTAGVSAGEGVTYNSAGMAYGHDYTSNPMYSQEFLVYSNGAKKIMLDGYIGSDMYTSVWCLGTCNPWGTMWTWIFGTSLLYDEGTELAWYYVNFDDYDASKSNYVVTNSSELFDQQHSYHIEKNYVKVSYSIPTFGTFISVSNMGVSDITNGEELLPIVYLPTANSVKASFTTGMCDLFWVNSDMTNIHTFGIMRGATTTRTNNAGINAFTVNYHISTVAANLGLRSMLINS